MKLPWPFSYLSDRRHRIRYGAAIATLLSIYVYDRLTDLQRRLVEEEIVRWYSVQGYEFSYIVDRPKLTADYLAFHRATAMMRLGFNVGIDGLNWSEVLPDSWKRSFGSDGFNEFRLFDPATDEAIAYLADRGVIVNASQKMGKKWIDSMRAKYP